MTRTLDSSRVPPARITVGGAATDLTVTGAGVTISDDDTALTLTANPARVSEGAGATTVTVTAATDGDTFPNGWTVKVKVGASGDGATSGTDYAAVSDFDVTIAAGATSGTATFTLTQDTAIEGDETITVAGASTGLTVNGTGVTLNDDDDTALTLTVNPARVSEGAGATTVTVTAATDGDTFKTARTVAVSVGRSGDPADSGTDYAAVSDFTITIAAGATSGTGTFKLKPTQDTAIEGDETITVAGTAGVLTVNDTSVTISDDDSTELTLTAAPASVGEGDGATEVTVTAATDGDTFKTARTVTVTVGKSDDGATSGTDYAAVSDFTVTITAGQTSGTGTFTLTPTDDMPFEGNETISVAGTATDLTVNGASVTLSDDDQPTLTLSADPPSVAETAGATEVAVTAATGGVNFEQDQAVLVTVGGSKDSATSGKDYEAVSDFTITISAGETSGTDMFTLTPKDDNWLEGDEQISVAGTSAGPLGAAQTSVTLTDDDRSALQRSKLPEIALSVSPSLVEEGDAPTTVTVTATVADGKAFQDEQEVTVTVGADGDSAQRGEDYARVSGTITIAAAQTSGSGTFTLSTIDDTVIEPEELITVSGTATAPDDSEVEVRGTGVAIVDDDDTEITLTAAPRWCPRAPVRPP